MLIKEKPIININITIMGFNLIGTFKCLQNANPFGLSSSGIHPIVIKLWSFLAPFIYLPLTSSPVNASWNVFPHEVARNYSYNFP